MCLFQASLYDCKSRTLQVSIVDLSMSRCLPMESLWEYEEVQAIWNGGAIEADMREWRSCLVEILMFKELLEKQPERLPKVVRHQMEDPCPCFTKWTSWGFYDGSNVCWCEDEEDEGPADGQSAADATFDAPNDGIELSP